MKSKSFNLKQEHSDTSKLNKTFDFVGLYKSAAETEKNLPEKRKSNDIPKDSSKSKQETLKRSPNKNRKKYGNEPVYISNISIDGSNLNSSVGPSTPRNDPKNTSTPIARVKSSTSAALGKVKSIMKISVVNEDDTMDGSKTGLSNPKKRNKSVSFMLDENEEIVVKRTKSDDSIAKKKDNLDPKKKLLKDKKKHLKKLRKEHQSEKENNLGHINQTVEKHKEKTNKRNVPNDIPSESIVDVNQNNTKEKKKKLKKNKTETKEDPTQTNEEISTNQVSEPLMKKLKKKKHKTKTDTEGEPVSKSCKKDMKPDIIAEDLENLSIGDNPHTLSSLLDEMTVADKIKRIKSKSKLKEKKKALLNNDTSQQSEEIKEKEKVKWKKRKWNKDKKGEMDTESLSTSIIVENLPLSIMLTYKKILADHFGKYGLIKKIGVAEMYPTVETTPVFTTMVNFYSDGAATQALQEDNTFLEGNQIRVKHPLPATETTLVLHSYAELNEQNICSLFSSAGKIRNIRHMVKGKKSMSTAFVEFDGPESVKKALKIATGTKIGGKKVHISKFQIRTKKMSSDEGDKPDEENSANSND